MREGTKTALIENAGDHIEAGDEIKAVMLGQTFVTPLLYLLIFPLVLILVIRSRSIAVSDRNIYLIDQSIWKQKEVQAVRKYPLGSTPVKVTALSVQVGDEEKVYALLGQGDERKKIAAATQGGAVTAAA